MSDNDKKKKVNKRATWVAIGAVILILLLLFITTVIESDGDPDNGFIAPLFSMLN